jgi:hypothetical protein
VDQPPAAVHPNPGRRRRAILLIAALLVPVLLMGGGALVGGALLAGVRAAYDSVIVEAGKEAAFLLTLAFLLTFGTVRLITYSIRHQKLPFLHDITSRGGLHVHHMVPGMVLALSSGYLAIVLTGRRPTEALAVLFGIGAALVLDEFALWLRLADVYWEPEGRESIDAVILASGIAVLYLLGVGFWPHLLEAVLAPLRALF